MNPNVLSVIRGVNGFVATTTNKAGTTTFRLINKKDFVTSWLSEHPADTKSEASRQCVAEKLRIGQIGNSGLAAVVASNEYLLQQYSLNEDKSKIRAVLVRRDAVEKGATKGNPVKKVSDSSLVEEFIRRGLRLPASITA